MYAIIITNTWTKNRYLHPRILDTIEDAEKLVEELYGKCSETKGVKNNEYAISPLYPVEEPILNKS